MNASSKARMKTAPCQAACPAGIDVPRYVRQVSEGRFADAVATIRERIPFPLVCGYACFHPCEAKCGRAQYEGPVAIRMLKRAAVEGSLEARLPTSLPPSGRNVAIVGSGPCGLTAAYYLVLLGHEVTVYEALERAGGMLRYGIPAYRLPDEVVDADLRLIEAAGVRIVTGRRVDPAESLLAQGYDAVLVASGAWRALGADIPGADRPHVIKGIEFLEAVNAGRPTPPGSRVVVVGGGDTAIDAARVCRRLGADVTLAYRRTRAQMPANADEVDAALDEGVRMEFLASPVRVDAGSLDFVRVEPGDARVAGQQRPQPVAGSEFGIPAETVILAVGQGVVAPTAALAREAGGTLRVDPVGLATSVPGVFAGGDVVTGPSSIIDAIAQGRRAAASVDRWLGGDGDLGRFCGGEPRDAVPPTAPRASPRSAWPLIPLASRLAGFALVEQSPGAETAIREAGRCLSCDLLEYDVRVDAAACKDCGYCKEVCGPDVFERSDSLNPAGYQPYFAARPDNCIGCLRCIYICPDFAITVEDAHERGSS